MQRETKSARVVGGLTKAQRRAIESTLPKTGIDRGRLLAELEISLRAVKRTPAFVQAQRRAAEFESFCKGTIRPELLSLQFGILWAWEAAGGRLPVSSRHKRRDEHHWPKPQGTVIPYYQAVSRAILQKEAGPEHIKDILSRYRRWRKFAGAGGLIAAADVLPAAVDDVVTPFERLPVELRLVAVGLTA